MFKPQGGWSFPTREELPPQDLVAWGADLDPATLVTAYSAGLFPMPEHPGESDSRLLWFCPEHRGVLPLEGIRVSRSLRRSRRGFEVRVDTAFEEVVRACADPRRPGAWIDEHFVQAYLALHHAGHAHAVEIWRDDELVGGLYGVDVGGLFAGESMFHRATDASKVALWALTEILDDGYAADRLVDVQWRTEHLASLGVVEIDRDEYLDRLAAAVLLPSAFAKGV